MGTPPSPWGPAGTQPQLPTTAPSPSLTGPQRRSRPHLAAAAAAPHGPRQPQRPPQGHGGDRARLLPAPWPGPKAPLLPPAPQALRWLRTPPPLPDTGLSAPRLSHGPDTGPAPGLGHRGARSCDPMAPGLCGVWGGTHTSPRSRVPAPVPMEATCARPPLAVAGRPRAQTATPVSPSRPRVPTLLPPRFPSKEAAGRGDRALFRASVGRQHGVDPGAQLGDAGVHAGHGGGAAAAAPRDDAHQGPGAVLLAHQRAPGVALRAAG